MEDKSYQTGDFVKLKSGSEKLIVHLSKPNETIVYWSDKNGDIHRMVVPTVLLEKA